MGTIKMIKLTNEYEFEIVVTDQNNKELFTTTSTKQQRFL